MTRAISIVRWLCVIPASFLGWFVATVILHNLLMLVLLLFRGMERLSVEMGFGFLGMGGDFSLFSLVTDTSAETWELILFAFAGPSIMSVLAAIIAPNRKFFAATLLAVINALHYVLSTIIFLPPVLEAINDYFGRTFESEWSWPFRLFLFVLNFIGIVWALKLVRENEY